MDSLTRKQRIRSGDIDCSNKTSMNLEKKEKKTALAVTSSLTVNLRHSQKEGQNNKHWRL